MVSTKLFPRKPGIQELSKIELGDIKQEELSWFILCLEQVVLDVLNSPMVASLAFVKSMLSTGSSENPKTFRKDLG